MFLLYITLCILYTHICMTYNEQQKQTWAPSLFLAGQADSRCKPSLFTGFLNYICFPWILSYIKRSLEKTFGCHVPSKLQTQGWTLLIGRRPPRGLFDTDF